MVGFGNHLEEEQNPDWGAFYLDYSLLKRKLKDAIEQRDGGDPAVFAALRDVLQGLFDNQIEKVLGFYASETARIKTEVLLSTQQAKRAASEAASNDDLTPRQKLEAVDDAIRSLRERALDITNLMSYVSLNMAGIRKILKKIAKNIPVDGPHGPGFLTLEIEHPHEPGWKLLQGTYLPARIGQELITMQRHKILQDLGKQVREAYEALHMEHDALRSANEELRDASPVATPHIHAAVKEKLDKLAGSFKYAAPLAARSRAEHLDELDEEADIVVQMDELLDQMALADKYAAKQAGFIHALTWEELQAGIFEPPPSDDMAIASTTGLLLNCINSGLYMANYNLVIPTITSLCAHIGVSDSAVGIIIGCCDIATIPGTLGYSLWTERSYKAPLIASAVACLLGNLAYCLSFDARALWLLVIGRLVTGFGSARAVNRRYIAMYVARENRTSASALFVSLSAVGMALGPLLALPLSHVPATKFLGITFGPITCGGWVMSAAWVVFVFWAIFAFEDPLKILAARDATNHSTRANDLEQPLLTADNPLVSQPGVATQSQNGITSQDISAPQAGEEAKEKGGSGGGFGAAIICCIFLCFILKVVQQSYIDGLPIFTLTEYHWSSGQCGIMLGVLGLVAPLVNTSVGAFSARLPDRHITTASILITGAGAGLLMRGTFPRWSFFAGGVFTYMGTIVLEAVSMSLCSKVIDEKMAKGLFNAGLLSTQAGTIGRFMGNLLLSACAGITGSRTDKEIGAFSSLLFGCSLASMAFSLAFVLLIYKKLIC